MIPILLTVLLAVTLSGRAAAQAEHHSPYANLQNREIKALSAEDVQALETGQGMGLALAGELNGYPGPRHVLELKGELALTAAQESAVGKIRDAMSSSAIEVGRRIVALERELDRAFAGKAITPERLASLTSEIGALQGRLRAIHLQAHLEVSAVLTPEQRSRYNHLRGYHGL